MMQVTVMQVIDVVAMLDRRVATAFSMLMRMFFVGNRFVAHNIAG